MIATTRPTSYQEYFNNAWRHAVIERNPPAFNMGSTPISKFSCTYRTPEGNRCLIGCSILDEDYKPEIENKPAKHVLYLLKYFAELPAVYNIQNEFLGDLQGVHDTLITDMTNYGNREIDLEEYFTKIKKGLTEFATKYNMEIPHE